MLNALSTERMVAASYGIKVHKQRSGGIYQAKHGGSGLVELFSLACYDSNKEGTLNKEGAQDVQPVHSRQQLLWFAEPH